MTKRACGGAGAISAGEMAECQECGTRVEWDLIDHAFWGFAASCPLKLRAGTVDELSHHSVTPSASAAQKDTPSNGDNLSLEGLETLLKADVEGLIQDGEWWAERLRDDTPHAMGTKALMGKLAAALRSLLSERDRLSFSYEEIKKQWSIMAVAVGNTRSFNANVDPDYRKELLDAARYLAERDTTEAENQRLKAKLVEASTRMNERLHLEVEFLDKFHTMKERAEAAEAHLLTTEAKPDAERGGLEPTEWTEQLPHAHGIAKQIIANVVKEYGDEVFIADGYEPGADLAVWISHAICDAYMGGKQRAGTVQPQGHAKATSVGAATQNELSTTEAAAFKAGYDAACGSYRFVTQCDEALAAYRSRRQS